MVHKFKPGQIALVRCYDGEPVPAMRFHDSWVYVDQDGRACNQTYDRAARVEPLRPLVVIDPEDREQVERLWRTWTNLAPSNPLAQDNLQAALREFANPPVPRPDEPTGLGAVVEDGLGDKWVRTTEPDLPWHCGEMVTFRDWSDINAVRVLSEGLS